MKPLFATSFVIYHYLRNAISVLCLLLVHTSQNNNNNDSPASPVELEEILLPPVRGLGTENAVSWSPTKMRLERQRRPREKVFLVLALAHKKAPVDIVAAALTVRVGSLS
jgi:hypothetical protein